DAREKECGFRLRRAQPYVAEQRDHRAGAHTDAVNRCDDRLPTSTHAFHEIARHARELEQPLHITVEQRSDDVSHIAARAEISLVRTEDDRLDVIGGCPLACRGRAFYTG